METQNKISFFKQGIWDVNPTKEINIQDLIDMLKGDLNNKQLELVRIEPDKDKRDILKKSLAYVTIAGTFNKRNNKELKKASSFACLDLDGEKDLRKFKQEDLETLKEKITKDNFGWISKDIYCCNSPICLSEGIRKGDIRSEDNKKLE